MTTSEFIDNFHSFHLLLPAPLLCGDKEGEKSDQFKILCSNFLSSPFESALFPKSSNMTPNLKINHETNCAGAFSEEI